MDHEVRDKAKGILSLGVAQIVNNYTENALLVNACFVSSERYTNLADTTGLSTIKGIPAPLRLKHEIDVQLSNEDLVRKYGGDVLDVTWIQLPSASSLKLPVQSYAHSLTALGF